jgi:ABC-type nitrate/sulfonate/bicarbonate transport system substrate-binding protein
VRPIDAQDLKSPPQNQVATNSNRKDAMKMRIGCVDLVSNGLFPVLAAEELGFYKAEGLDTHVEQVRDSTGPAALRDGSIDAMAGVTHLMLKQFPRWEGAKLVIAIQQGTPFLLVTRVALHAKRGDIQALRGLRIASDAGPIMAFQRLLIEGGLDPERDVQIVNLPGSDNPNISFGMFAARALEEDRIDGFWANAMGSEIAVRRGVGKIFLDVRRGDGPAAVRHFTFVGLVTTDALIERDPERVSAAVRAIVKTQQALRADPNQATEVGKRRFPPDAADLIATLVERDLPFYDPTISEEAVAGLNRFAQAVGLVPGPVPYEQVVAVRFRDLWRS